MRFPRVFNFVWDINRFTLVEGLGRVIPVFVRESLSGLFWPWEDLLIPIWQKFPRELAKLSGFLLEIINSKWLDHKQNWNFLCCSHFDELLSYEFTMSWSHIILQVVFHGIVTIIMVTITSILTAGYVDTCQNLYREVKWVNWYERLIKPVLFGYEVGWMAVNIVYINNSIFRF